MSSFRLFTLEQANQLIPVIEPQIRLLQETVKEMRTCLQQLEEVSAAGPVENAHDIQREAEVTALTAEVQAIAQEVQEGVQRVQACGCEVKDIESGLIDFRAARENRVVYLCWRLGESEIRFFHEIEAGFAGRQPL